MAYGRSSYNRDWQTLSLKGHIVHIVDFTCRGVRVARTVMSSNDFCWIEEDTGAYHITAIVTKSRECVTSAAMVWSREDNQGLRHLWNESLGHPQECNLDYCKFWLKKGLSRILEERDYEYQLWSCKQSQSQELEFVTLIFLYYVLMEITGYYHESSAIAKMLFRSWIWLMQKVDCIRCFSLFSISPLISVLGMVDSSACVLILSLGKVAHLKNMLHRPIFFLSPSTAVAIGGNLFGMCLQAAEKCGAVTTAGNPWFKDTEAYRYVSLPFNLWAVTVTGFLYSSQDI